MLLFSALRLSLSHFQGRYAGGNRVVLHFIAHRVPLHAYRSHLDPLHVRGRARCNSVAVRVEPTSEERPVCGQWGRLTCCHRPRAASSCEMAFAQGTVPPAHCSCDHLARTPEHRARVAALHAGGGCKPTCSKAGRGGEEEVKGQRIFKHTLFDLRVVGYLTRRTHWGTPSSRHAEVESNVFYSCQYRIECRIARTLSEPVNCKREIIKCVKECPNGFVACGSAYSQRGA